MYTLLVLLMFYTKQVIKLDKDPLADHTTRTGVILSEPEYDDWANSARYNVVCLTTDFEEYKSHDNTYKIHKQKHTETGALKSHSLVCPWATVALPGSSLTHITGDALQSEKVTLTDEGHEVASRAVYEFLSAHNDY